MSDHGEQHRLIIEQYGDAIYSTCMRILRQHHDAEDASQEAVLKILRSDYSAVTNVAAWVHTVAANCAKEYIRKQQRLRQRHRDGHHAVTPQADEPEANELLDALDTALLAMDPGMADLLRQHYLLGTSQSALAKQASISQPAVRKRLQRAMDALHAQLKRAGLIITLSALLSRLEAGEGLTYTAPNSLRALVLAEAGRTATTASLSLGSVTAVLITVVVLVGGTLYLSRTANNSPVATTLTQPTTTVGEQTGSPARSEPTETATFAAHRAADGGLIPEQLIIDTNFHPFADEWNGIAISMIHERGIEYGEPLPAPTITQAGLQLQSRHGLRWHNMFQQHDAYRLQLSATVSNGDYFNIFGLPISPATPWLHRYENMSVSHQLGRDRFTIIMECSREENGRWDVSYSLNGVPMHRGLYDLANANDLVLYTLNMNATVHHLRVESCRKIATVRVPAAAAPAPHDQDF